MIPLQAHIMSRCYRVPSGNQDGGRRTQTHAKRNGTVKKKTTYIYLL